ncbi:GNAT family N-acetyltransferase [Aestuariicella sp. G3-2]|uniref:GNAT family N-acetyltransferase n=1 Tax=Pseudomaricurvus albidus TaxID=2842452 RepID=UPI001C0DD655|nr:GNAT family protein [Aestuariicella albida]MBU3070619.1 GNAT family N-acetyltransferase [Aestuariicella albida]
MYKEVTLEGSHLRLEPLQTQHRDGLIRAICDGELWKLFVTLIPHPDHIDAYMEKAFHSHRNGEGLTFVTIDKASGQIVGSSRFMNAHPQHQRVEIGSTFLAKRYQRTPFNTEAKLLMLTHAFESLKLNRVEFLTDFLNQTSRNAILRLGAKMEGILRSHMVMPDGRVRDSVIFSITRHEWPGVKQHLISKLNP